MLNERKLFLALLGSGLLNIGLLVYIGYDYVRDRAPIAAYAQITRMERGENYDRIDGRTNCAVIASLESKKMVELIESLTDRTLVEDGYTVRDLTLACMVKYHHFDLSRALLGYSHSLQKREILDKNQNAITVYPALTEEQFSAILQFAIVERWPITPKGLFERLKMESENSDPTLFEAFYLTKEFLAVETLFSQEAILVQREEICAMVLAGEWEILEKNVERGKVADRLISDRRECLFDYLAVGANPAARLLLVNDGDFVRKKVDDRTVLKILELIDPFTEEAKLFSLDLLTSIRSDQVRELAARLLYFSHGKEVPEPFRIEAALEEFLSEDPGEQKKEEEWFHTVHKGDSLWKISRKYKIPVETLKLVNGLDKEVLRPGRRIRIPANNSR